MVVEVDKRVTYDLFFRKLSRGKELRLPKMDSLKRPDRDQQEWWFYLVAV